MKFEVHKTYFNLNAKYLWENYTEESLLNAAIVFTIFDEKNGGEFTVGEIYHPLLNADEKINDGTFNEKLPNKKNFLDYTVNYGIIFI